MTSADLGRCQHELMSGYHMKLCAKTAAVTAANGRMYCRVHDPEAIAKRREKSAATFNARWTEESRRIMYGRLGPEMLAVLKDIHARLPRWSRGDVQAGPSGRDSDFGELTARVAAIIAKAGG